MSGRLPRPRLGSLCLFLASFLVGVIGAEPLHAQTTLQSGNLVLSATGDRARLALPDGKTLPLTLPERTEISSLAELERSWMVAASVPEGGRRLLLLLAGDEAGSRALPVPADQRGTQRRGAVLLAREGRLHGMAWLEGDGDRGLSVRAAAWDGERWGAPEAVSRIGPGSQLALTGAVLAKGSWVLAWSAFDGEDDEIVWSRRSAEGRWSPVRPVSEGNSVPDITPTLAAAGDGALIAWSRYDGNELPRPRGAARGNGMAGRALRRARRLDPPRLPHRRRTLPAALPLRPPAGVVPPGARPQWPRPAPVFRLGGQPGASARTPGPRRRSGRWFPAALDGPEARGSSPVGEAPVTRSRVLLFALALSLPASAALAQTGYIAFGDSITAGIYDDPARVEKGYPPRLETLLQSAGINAVVENHGLGGEDTSEGVTRIDSVLSASALSGDVLLLMEGTNDISPRTSRSSRPGSTSTRWRRRPKGAGCR